MVLCGPGILVKVAKALVVVVVMLVLAWLSGDKGVGLLMGMEVCSL